MHQYHIPQCKVQCRHIIVTNCCIVGHLSYTLWIFQTGPLANDRLVSCPRALQQDCSSIPKFGCRFSQSWPAKIMMCRTLMTFWFDILSNYERKLIFLYVFLLLKSICEVEVLYFYFHVLDFYLSILVQFCAWQLITLVSCTRVYMILNNKWAKIWPQAVTCGHFSNHMLNLDSNTPTTYEVPAWSVAIDVYFTELILFAVALFPIVNVTYHFQFLNNKCSIFQIKRKPRIILFIIHKYLDLSKGMQRLHQYERQLIIYNFLVYPVCTDINCKFI